MTAIDFVSVYSIFGTVIIFRLLIIENCPVSPVCKSGGNSLIHLTDEIIRMTCPSVCMFAR